ncbi:N2227-domain-containing protein [Microthyrium microscopicum]|uniref:carnosine N-methyltransferase n=1 Tax=Microthyrium microscopicum TaxID=703497 RepID=A0A6A6UDC1_9PEZI|nr:N2227-domain-containing protein [Microthyrium microscopicum]
MVTAMLAPTRWPESRRGLPVTGLPNSVAQLTEPRLLPLANKSCHSSHHLSQNSSDHLQHCISLYQQTNFDQPKSIMTESLENNVSEPFESLNISDSEPIDSSRIDIPAPPSTTNGRKAPAVNLAMSRVDWSRHQFGRARIAYDSYRLDTIKTILRPREQHLSSLKKEGASNDPVMQFLNKKLSDKFTKVSKAIEAHSTICARILETSTHPLIPNLYTGKDPSTSDQAIVRSTIRQLFRDWTVEGSSERDVIFKPILTAIRAIAKNHTKSDSENFAILVPGAGLCRLAVEIAKLAPSADVIANELSYHQILAVHWILSNREARQYAIQPWALQFSNHVSASDQFRSYLVPEENSIIIAPYQQARLDVEGDKVLLRCANLTVTPYDFRQYSNLGYEASMDVVVTAFFLDTAPNVAEYVATIKHVLKTGGTWINAGPLLWNCFENGPAGKLEGDLDDHEAARARQSGSRRFEKLKEQKAFEGKVELAWDEVMELIELMGFRIEVNDPDLGEAGYIMDTDSMLQATYKVGYFQVVKL